MWIAFCSQTGSEIFNLSKKINLTPAKIITNNYDKLSLQIIQWAKDNNILIHRLPNKPELKDYNEIGLGENDFISLHGYLRIIPAEICSKFQIYNGHPALITPEYYPELKGKDPQERTWENRSKYKSIGVVIHRVISEIDEGEVCLTISTKNSVNSKEELYSVLRNLSLESWIIFWNLTKNKLSL